MSTRKARIEKKLHTRYQAEFLFECSQDPQWAAKLQALEGEQVLESAQEGMPADLLAAFPELDTMALNYCIERVELNEVPRDASCWWPLEEGTQFFLCYPARFPQAALYLAVDFDDHAH
jgi:hypothetical protein